jgi:hypothetical protein
MLSKSNTPVGKTHLETVVSGCPSNSGGLEERRHLASIILFAMVVCLKQSVETGVRIG